jgi:lipopolysaccharide transport system ATP-binding protein
MPDTMISVENLSKLYHIGARQERHDTLRDALVDTARRIVTRRARRQGDRDEIWALNDVSFEVKRGDVLGIIGRNGAGKSTLLKILSQITEPTLGRAVINGRIGSLLEVGTGFHPELTGRENIYLNGAILGMSRKDIDNKFDEIVDFAEIDKFLDTPVKRYSSGMYVRLGFAVAAHLEPEVLIVDEVLSVGDVAFQKKCLGKMEKVSRTGRTVLFVSHNMQSIGDLCTDAILIDYGRIVVHDLPNRVIQKYLSLYRREKNSQAEAYKRTEKFLIDRVACFGESSDEGIKPLSELNIEIDVTPLLPVPDMSIHIDILGDDHTRLLGFDSVDFGVIVEPKLNQKTRFQLRLPYCPLPPGKYSMDVYIKNYSRNIFDHFEFISDFDVEQVPVYGNRLYDPRWHGRSITNASMATKKIC